MTRMNQCTSSGTFQQLPERVKADLPVKEGQSTCVCVCCVNNLLHMYLLVHVITHVTVPQFHAQHNHTLSFDWPTSLHPPPTTLPGPSRQVQKSPRWPLHFHPSSSIPAPLLPTSQLPADNKRASREGHQRSRSQKPL